MAAQTGFLATVSLDDGAQGVYVAVTNVISIKTPPRTGGKTEVKALGTRLITYLPTLIERGEIEIECLYSRTEYSRLLALLSVLTHNIQITMSNSDTIICDGWISHVGESTLDAENVQKFTWKWQVGTTVTGP